MNVHKDLKWQVADLERDFEKFRRDLEDYLEDLGSAMQPLGLHTLGRDAEPAHLVNNIMQMLGQPLYSATGVGNAKAAFRSDYRKVKESKPYRFVEEWVFSDKPVGELSDARLRALAEKGRKFLVDLRAAWEIEGVSRGLAARWIDPSYGGDPIRNPDALHTAPVCPTPAWLPINGTRATASWKSSTSRACHGHTGRTAVNGAGSLAMARARKSMPMPSI